MSIFSVLPNRARKLAYSTAVNIDGAPERRRGDRAADTWWTDDRDDNAYVAYQVGNTFYKKSGFERGHLVRRLDPAWGADDAEAARGEADSFHFFQLRASGAQAQQAVVGQGREPCA